jgi:hypothetical protein
LFVIAVVPYIFKGFIFQVSQLVHGVFVEAAGNYQSIPGNNIGMPEFPAMVCQFILCCIFTV